MPESAANPIYFVDPYSDPVLVRIVGRANFQNGGCLRDFITEMLRQGKKRFIIDFHECTSMDSTFLGLLAGVAMDLRKNGSRGSLVLMRVGPRNLELVRNLGLNRLMTVEGGDAPAPPGQVVESLDCPDRSELENARLALEAHENLVAADERNRTKFQDVLVFLKTRVEKR
jgi:anti-anti-sigma factor